MIDPFRSSSESLGAELARVSRERDELERKWLAERAGAIPSTASYLRAVFAVTASAVAGMLVASGAPGVTVALVTCLSMWLLRPALRPMRPKEEPAKAQLPEAALRAIAMGVLKLEDLHWPADDGRTRTNSTGPGAPIPPPPPARERYG